MKTFLLAVIGICAFSGMHMTAFAIEQDSALRPADELAQMDGLDQSADLDSDTSTDALLYPPPPPHPHPAPPYHPAPPPYHPPHPYPPHPYPPHPVPVQPPYPGQWWYECTSQDQYGTTYSNNGNDPRRVQWDVHNYCEYQSNGPCYDLGCRRY
jgi:hypothetical protein